MVGVVGMLAYFNVERVEATVGGGDVALALYVVREERFVRYYGKLVVPRMANA